MQKIKAGDDVFEKLSGRFYPKKIYWEFPSPVKLHFISDHTNTGKGFKATYVKGTAISYQKIIEFHYERGN